ncbi:hypothetical protein NLU13_1392 [Sarocladium strictum]|uniref:Non-homologous end-joining factor 1 n=1 Tax=Sarocladium strictum TaxID=5046 RepID=A0AA39LCF9_SARSR|nr:hypothetical protein NLU13_1392 [Sarocladium strictum]
MPASPSWWPLPFTPSAEVPPLLVSMEGGPSDYTVRITDMANVWIECLDRKHICMRAWNLDTSIDPSDTPENMAKFLNSIRSALDASQQGHDQTSLVLLPGKYEDAGTDGLVLKIDCEIPGLKNLRWTMQLAKAPTSAVATSVVIPLLQAQLARAREVEALKEMVRRKDSVMAKLLDKLEATGTGLENVFNSLSTSITGRKKVSRAAAGEKVRGLAPFNEELWQEEMRSAADGPADVTSLIDRVFTGDGTHYESSMEAEETPGLDRWWHDFRGTKRVPLHSGLNQPPTKANTPPTTETLAAEEEDDFQVQSTPPGLKPSRRQDNNGSAADAEMDSTASENEAQSSPASAKRRPQPNTRVQAGVSRLGTIGGKRQDPKQPSPNSPKPETCSKSEARPGPGSETASEADDDMTASVLEPSSPPPPAKSPARKIGLGRIGGPKLQAAQDEHVARSTSPDERPKATPTPKKLGIIGKRGPDKAVEGGDSDDRGRSREAAQPNRETPRETSQERADRKRNELKRELEKKAAAGPVKKKRKF